VVVGTVKTRLEFHVPSVFTVVLEGDVVSALPANFGKIMLAPLGKPVPVIVTESPTFPEDADSVMFAPTVYTDVAPVASVVVLALATFAPPLTLGTITVVENVPSALTEVLPDDTVACVVLKYIWRLSAVKPVQIGRAHV
jgi:hypothetical protein